MKKQLKLFLLKQRICFMKCFKTVTGIILGMGLFLAMASSPAHAQAQDPDKYIFMLRDGSTYNILNGATEGSTQNKNTTIFTSKCIWIREGDKVKFVESGLYLYLRRLDSYGYIGDAAGPGGVYTNTLEFNNWMVQAPGYGLDRELAFATNWRTNNLYDDRKTVICKLTFHEAGWDAYPMIDDEKGRSVFDDLASDTYDRSQAAAYHNSYYAGTGHTSNTSSGNYTFFAYENEAITETKKAPLRNFTYTWSLWNENGTPYTGNKVTVNTNTGVVTYVSPVSEETTLNLRLTATWNDDSSITAYDERPLTFKPLHNPTGITAENMVMDLHEVLPGNNYTLQGTPEIYDYVTAVSADENIVTVTNTNGRFSVLGRNSGATTVTITAHNIDGSNACTCTFNVIVRSAEPPHATGIEDQTVYVNDLEDHAWSYYSDGNQPIHNLNPADVKITYKGNGDNMVATSNDANPGSTFTASTNGTVKVGIASNENQDTFIYYKTLERENPDAGTGRCGYAVIPNPFQVRPTYGTDNTTKWRGFYKWRLKSVNGGTVYDANGSQVNENSMVDADAQLFFEPMAEYGMEVEFEALWARAYVVVNRASYLYRNNCLNSSSFQADTYERNFYVFHSDYNANATDDVDRSGQKPVTISSRYPDGTLSNATPKISCNFTCNNATKFEYVTFNASGKSINGNAYDLTIGRGVSGTIYSVNGIMASSSLTSATRDFRLRIESGQFTKIRFAGVRVSYSGKMTAVLGNDYDRVRNYNDYPKVTGTECEVLLADAYSNGYNIYPSTISTGTIGGKALDCTVKSGDYDWGGYAGSFQFYVSAVSSTIDASRKLVVEGGKFADIAGGIETSDNLSTIGSYTSSDGKRPIMVDMRFKGGTMNGAVFGAAQYSGSAGDRRMVITGGDFKGWIAGGCNGTKLNGGELYGSTFIYVGGDAKVLQTGTNPFDAPDDAYIGTRHVLNTTDGTGAYGGNIFGAGCGFHPKAYDDFNNPGNPNTTVGKVFGSTIVVADSAVVGRDVYGGGKFGFVADNTTGDTGLSGNTVMKSCIYILGGTVHGDVMGGSENQINQAVEIYVRGGELVGRAKNRPDSPGGATALDNLAYYGSVYGGCDSWGDIKGTATIEMTGGHLHGDVFGGGYGIGTNMTKDVKVTVAGGLVEGSVYGGGENGMTGKGITSNPVKTTVNITGGEIRGNVFGGAIGTSGNIHVFGLKTVNIGVGANGTVNNHNCYIGGSVYGGSEKADDYYEYSASTPSFDKTKIGSRVNIASGYIQYHVFGSGFFGKTYGSTKVYIGKNAIHQAPGHETTLTGPTGYDEPNILDIRGNVYGGADYGAFDGVNFGASTISGYSDVYIDGLDYNTQTKVATDEDYMNITGSVYGCGTSCYSGKKGSGIYVRNYGFAVSNPDYSDGDDLPPYLSSTRDLQSIQFTDTLVLDAAHIHFPGQGKINSLVTTEKYSLFEITKVARVANGSSLFIDYPIDSLMKLGSYSCTDVYASDPSYTKIGYDGLDATDNKIRVNNGTAIYVHHNKMVPINAPGYGELEGFFHLMNDGENTAYAYARPRQSSDANNQIGDTYNNAADGGFVGYLADKNTYSGGDATSTANAPGHVDENGVQIPYENHAPASKAGEQYFRIWQYRTGLHSVRNGVFDAHSNGTSDTYSVAEVVIDLPPFVSGGKYRIKTDDGYLYINYGEDVKTVNAGYTAYPGLYTSIPTTENSWMYYGGSPAGFQGGNAINQTNVASGLKSLNEEPDLHFGLVMIPEGGFGTGSPALIHSSANTTLAGMSWTKDNEQNPKLRFRLTYSNGLQANAVLEPMTIVFEQYTGEGDEATVVDEVEVKLSVATSTNISQTFKTEVYAVMNGKGTPDDTYTAHVTFPTYVPHTVEYSEWSLKQVVWTPNTSGDHGDASFVAGSWVANSQGNYNGEPAKFAMTCEAALNVDNTLGWERSELRRYDAYNFKNSTPWPNDIGSSLGRHSATIDFTLHYDGSQAVPIDPDPWKIMGVLTFHFTVPNCEAAGSPSYTQDVVVEVEIKRIGRGNNWYLDGVNGSNNYAGNFPNAAMKTLGAIFSRTDYQPGDNIYIVNQVSSGNSALEWNGWNYDGVTLYRYPGGHLLSQSNDESECIPAATYTENTGDSQETPVAYKGVLVNVTSNMTMQEIILDGHDQKHDNDAAVEAEAPSVVITEGNTLSLNASTLQHNYNSVGDAGAVMMESNATLNMDYGSDIQHNAVAQDHKGGGVYMNGGSVMNVDNKVIINNNTEGLTDGTPSNVYQDTYRTWVNVGEHPDAEMKIGVTKTEFYDDVMDRLCAYTPIAHSDYVATANLIQSEQLFYDDRTAFNVLKYNESHLSHPERYDYFLGTWFSAVNTKPGDFNAQEIDTPEELAWAISVVNGRTNQDPGGNVVTPNPNTNFKLTGDIDMSDNLWVPIAKDNDHAYTGTFDGNGHVVTGIRSPLYSDDMGLIGVLGTNGVVENMVAQVEFRDGPMKNIGSIAGTNAGGTIRNCEGGGTLIGTASTENIGGLVGKTTGGTIHSGFATNDITAVGETKVGGLVGENGANLYNSYSNVTISGGHAGGLVGVNKLDCIVENCYTTLTTNAFAYENNGYINYCYMPYAETPSYYGTNNSTVTGHGTYNPVLSVSDYGYMYDDNQVTVPSDNGTNNYVVTDITYAERPVSGSGDPTAMNRIVEWPGMLSALNRWVKVNSTSALTYTPWFRPVAAEINGDLPVLGFPKDISMATTDGRFLDYSASLDGHLTKFNTQKETAHLFLYKNATEVEEVPLTHVHVSINEDAVLKQFVSTDPEKPTGEFINTTVGVSFDNSHKAASDHFGTTLAYDWHFLSTPLADAPLGIDYDEGGVNPWTGEDPQHSGNQVRNVSNSYLPNGSSAEDYAHWDLYCFYEPAYHWINLKRNSDSHYHYNVDENGVHQQITYTNEETFLPGKGYMAAIDKDTYLNSTGTLNGPASDVEVMLTKQSVEPGIDEKGFNLLGNPYQAYLDVNAFLGSSKNSSYLESSYWVYIAEQNNYVAGNAEASSNPALPSAKLHPHQGFFVLAKDEGDDKKVTFEYSMALDNPTQYSYFRDGQVDYPLVNLYVTDTKGMRDLAVMEFNRPEQGGSVKPHGLNNANFELAAQMNGARYSILFTKQGTERVPVSFTTREDGSFTLTWDTYHGNFTSLFLVDNMTGTRTDMLHTDHYTFHSTPDDYAARFYITFKCTEVNDITVGDEFAWYDGNQWNINGTGTLEVIDVLGRILLRRDNASTVSTANLAPGVYMLRLSDGTSAKVQKIVVR